MSVWSVFLVFVCFLWCVMFIVRNGDVGLLCMMFGGNGLLIWRWWWMLSIVVGVMSRCVRRCCIVVMFWCCWVVILGWCVVFGELMVIGWCCIGVVWLSVVSCCLVWCLLMVVCFGFWSCLLSVLSGCFVWMFIICFLVVVERKVGGWCGLICVGVVVLFIVLGVVVCYCSGLSGLKVNCDCLCLVWVVV